MMQTTMKAMKAGEKIKSLLPKLFATIVVVVVVVV
jgi:hypothetical protein